MKKLIHLQYFEEVMISHFTIEIIGFAAIALDMLCCQIKNPRRALVLYTAPAILWIVHLGLLSETAGVAIMAISIIRDCLAAYLPEKQMRISSVFFIGLAVAIAFFTSEQIYDYFIIAAVFIFGASLFMRDKPLHYRCLCLTGEMLWLAYGVWAGSYALIAAECILGVSIILSIIRNDYHDIILPYIKRLRSASQATT